MPRTVYISRLEEFLEDMKRDVWEESGVDGPRRDDDDDDGEENGENATAAAVEEAGARGWDVVHAGEKPAMAGTQDRPSSDAAMTFIVVWFDLLNDAATTGADGSGTRNSMANVATLSTELSG
jgi:hypothetical protein